MKKFINQKYFLIFIVVIFIFGWITVSAMTDNNSFINTAEQKHFSETNCNIDEHYENGNHIHDIENCTDSNHNHDEIKINTVNNIEQKHYDEVNCNVSSHFTNGVHYHDTTNCTNENHNHNSNHNKMNDNGNHGCKNHR